MAESYQEDVAGQGHRGGGPSGNFCWPGADVTELQGLAARCKDAAGMAAVETMHQA